MMPDKLVFQKVLIANRGEVATRVIRACQELGIRTAAVFTEADKHAMHVKKADEAYLVSPSPVAGYLNVEQITDLAKAVGCDALHPGYGFLAENPDLPEACALRRITYIGPSARQIRAMGDKTLARQMMKRVGIPVIPGTEGNVASVEEARTFAKAVGYPVMLKATTGGGGRGIRRCEDKRALRENFDRARSEAQSAFGRAEVFVEKAIDHARHIEFQVLRDAHGHTVHLFERDCSIQRRHQKLIEVAPSPALDERLRARMGQAAINAAEAVDYLNAGTVEFLLAPDGRFYFLEMNTRLQVEHTITETITGRDIVQEQIRIAAGLPLSFKQDEVGRRGVAMEFRINAEDPKEGFRPDVGRVTRYASPGGPGVRIDGFIYKDYEITPYFDSMCAKLTIWALDWDGAVRRALRALHEYDIRGVKTTIPFFIRIVEHPDFRAGRFDTSFIDAHPELLDYRDPLPMEERAAIVAAAIVAYHGL
jgi:pyruvate carboxylase subunit A